MHNDDYLDEDYEFTKEHLCGRAADVSSDTRLEVINLDTLKQSTNDIEIEFQFQLRQFKKLQVGNETPIKEMEIKKTAETFKERYCYERLMLMAINLYLFKNYNIDIDTHNPPAFIYAYVWDISETEAATILDHTLDAISESYN